MVTKEQMAEYFRKLEEDKMRRMPLESPQPDYQRYNQRYDRQPSGGGMSFMPILVAVIISAVVTYGMLSFLTMSRTNYVSDITRLENDIVDVRQVNDQQASGITSLQGVKSSADAALTRANQAIEAVGGIPEIQESVTALNQDLLAFKAEVQEIIDNPTQPFDPTALQNSVNTINSQITTINSQITTINTAITELQDGIGDIEIPSLTALTSSITALTTRVGTAESDIDALQANATTLQATLTSLQGIYNQFADIAEEYTNTPRVEITNLGNSYIIFKVNTSSKYAVAITLYGTAVFDPAQITIPSLPSSGAYISNKFALGDVLTIVIQPDNLSGIWASGQSVRLEFGTMASNIKFIDKDIYTLK